MSPSLEKLCTRLAYQFKDINLLQAALSHRSVQGENNERLEFLGDSILNFIIAESLYKHLPKAREGELTRIRASLVKGETLTTMAQEFDLGEYLRLGPGELKSGGYRRASILADAVEAIIGAIYLDAGFPVCQEVVLRWYASRLKQSALDTHDKDAKTRLQEFLQAKKFPLPSYDIKKISGDDHNQVFHIECSVEGLTWVAAGSGSSRRRAEQEAAEKLLNMATK